MRYLGSLIIVLSVALTGCASRSASSYPVLEQTKESDDDLTCRLLDEDILEANALRDQILDEHGDVIRDAVAGTAVDAVFDPVGAIMNGVWKSVSVSSSAKQYTAATAAAGSRMQQLLVYKREKNCPSGVTANPMMDDYMILDGLEDAEKRFASGMITDKEYIEERVDLLNEARPDPFSQ